jgi:hypothetical protein
MKRNSSDIPSSPISSASDTDVKPIIQSTPLKSHKARPSPKTSNPNKKKKESHEKESKETGAGAGEWNGEKKALMMETIIAAGFKATDLETLAEKVSVLLILSDDMLILLKLGVSKQQIHIQLRAGKKGNVREKVVQALRAEK